MAEKLLTRRQARERLPLSDPTYWRLEQRGILKPVRIGRNCFYREADIDEIVANGLQSIRGNEAPREVRSGRT